jgi:hypothetical protein
MLIAPGDARALAAPLTALTRVRHLHLATHDYHEGADAADRAAIPAALGHLALLTHLFYGIDLLAEAWGELLVQSILPLPDAAPLLASLDLGDMIMPSAALLALGKALQACTALTALVLPAWDEGADTWHSHSSKGDASNVVAYISRAGVVLLNSAARSGGLRSLRLGNGVNHGGGCIVGSAWGLIT